MPLAFPVAPMKATLGTLPDEPAGSEPSWAFEIKWDGHRTILHLDGARVRVQSGGGHDVTTRWHELVDIADSVHAPEAILDGEVVVLGADGLPSFDLVQRRHGRNPNTGDSTGRSTEGHLMFHAFDVLAIGTTETTGLPYLDRRRLLEQLLDEGPHWRVPDHRIGGGADLVAATAELGLEGVIAKRIDSVYRVGARTKEWRKIKHRRVVDLPIGGYSAGSGRRAGSFGALLLGRVDPETAALRFAGGVGTGFDDATLDSVLARLHPLSTTSCPFDPAPPGAVTRTATWVRPEYSARVEIAEFTNDGHVRHATFVDLLERTDE